MKLNLLRNDAERIQARVTNPRQLLWSSKTRTSWETDRLIEILFDSTTDAGNFGIRYQDALAANNQINSGEEWELNEKRMNEALIYSSVIPIDSMEQSLKDDIATLAHTCPFVAGQAVYKARRIWSFWQPNALFDDRVLCLQTDNIYVEGEIDDIDEYYNQQIHSLQDVVTGTFGNQKEKEIPKTFDTTRIYPNPVSSIINIDLGKKMEAEFILYNSFGEEVVKIKLINAKSTYNLSHLIPGLYHFRIQYSNGENESGKFTKL